jgi:hypothetical protein
MTTARLVVSGAFRSLDFVAFCYSPKESSIGCPKHHAPNVDGVVPIGSTSAMSGVHVVRNIATGSRSDFRAHGLI